MENANPVATDPRVVAAELKEVVRQALKLKRSRQRTAKYRSTHRSQTVEAGRKWRENNPEKSRRASKRWTKANVDPEKTRTRLNLLRERKLVEEPPEKRAERARVRTRAYRTRHPEKATASVQRWKADNALEINAYEQNRTQEKRTDKVMVAAMALHGELMPVLPLPST